MRRIIFALPLFFLFFSFQCGDIPIIAEDICSITQDICDYANAICGIMPKVVAESPELQKEKNDLADSSTDLQRIMTNIQLNTDDFTIDEFNKLKQDLHEIREKLKYKAIALELLKAKQTKP